MEPSVSQLLEEYWSQDEPKSVALWADSTYGPLEQVNIMKMAKEMEFPLSSFTCSFGAGLTVKGDFHDPAGQPADVVIIEMGYNDENSFSPTEAIEQMRKRKWYSVLWSSAAQIKFVVFVHQPTYKQTCPPRKKKKKRATEWAEGAPVEGSKWTDEAMTLVAELGIPTLCLKVPAAQLFEGMLVSDECGVVWQSGGRSYTEAGVDYTEEGNPALWEDSWHPTKAGAEVHFRSLVKVFTKEFGSPDDAPAATPGPPPRERSRSPKLVPKQRWAGW